jgi:hypothetical protein
MMRHPSFSLDENAAYFKRFVCNVPPLPQNLSSRFAFSFDYAMINKPTAGIMY